MKLGYEAYDRAGVKVHDVIEAAGVDEARQTLRKQGLFVTRIGASAWSGGDSTGGQWSLALPRLGRSGSIGGGRLIKHLVSFARQLHVLVSTGTPLVHALESLERQAQDPSWRQVVAKLRHRMEEGGSLSGAMAEQPAVFDAVGRSLIAAGESSGKLSAMLQRWFTLVRKQQHVRSTVLGAMVYPIVLMSISLVVSVVMVVFVLPRFAEMFKSMGVPLPAMTAAMMAAGEFAREFWYALPPALFAAVWGLKAWLRSASGIKVSHTLLVRLPPIGKLTQSFATARITRLMGMLLDSYLPLLEVLQLTRDSITNIHYRRLLQRAEDSVTRGEPISSAFNAPGLIHPSVYEAVRSGESSGNIGPILLNMADFLDEDNEIVLKSLSSIIEPVILIVLGVVIGLMAMSIFLPLFDLTAMTAGGGG